MVPTLRLYALADELGARVLWAPISGPCKALAVWDPGWRRWSILLDPALERSETDLRCALAEELGHVATAQVYAADGTRGIVVSRCEERAFRWAATLLMPVGEVVTALVAGATVHDLSEQFVVTVPFAARAVAWYSRWAARAG